MISDEDFEHDEKEIGELFARETPPPGPADERRIDRIVERALFENVVKDTTSFLFTSFSSALGGLTGAMAAALPKPSRPGPEAEPGEGRRSPDED